MHAGDDNLLVSRGDRSCDVLHDEVDRLRPARASRRWDDAVAASLLAAGLHTKRERGAARDPWNQRLSARTVTQMTPDPITDFVLLVVRHDERDVRQGGQLIRTTRRVTAGHDNLHAGIGADDAADGLTRALIRARGHRAGVDDHQIRLLGGRALAAPRAQVALDGEGIRLVHAAAEGDERILHGWWIVDG